jgi:hypothetical protein
MNSMPLYKFFAGICLSVCLSAPNSANDDTAIRGAKANNQAEKPYSKTFLLSADGKSALAIQASRTDLGRQLSDFLLEPSRQLELARFSRETLTSDCNRSKVAMHGMKFGQGACGVLLVIGIN